MIPVSGLETEGLLCLSSNQKLLYWHLAGCLPVQGGPDTCGPAVATRRADYTKRQDAIGNNPQISYRQNVNSDRGLTKPVEEKPAVREIPQDAGKFPLDSVKAIIYYYAQIRQRTLTNQPFRDFDNSPRYTGLCRSIPPDMGLLGLSGRDVKRATS